MVYFDAPISVLDPHSDQAGAISGLIWLAFAFAFGIVMMVSILVIWAALKYRHRTQGGDDSEPRQVSGNFRMEVAWTVAPAIVLVGLFIPTVIVMNKSDPAVPANTQPQVEIVGHQWWWEYRYFDPNGKVIADTANVMYLPVGKDAQGQPLRLIAKLSSADVIHDWWVPQLGRKMDNNPGLPNYEWLRDAARLYADFGSRCVAHGL